MGYFQLEAAHFLYISYMIIHKTFLKNKVLVISILSMFLGSCVETKDIVDQDTGTKMEVSNSGTTTCQLIEKPFIIKNGVESDVMELYLRCSVQDYFIKLCESDVAAEELRKHLNEGVTVEMEIKEGQWDKCKGDFEVQSRIGTYIIISAIVK